MPLYLYQQSKNILFVLEIGKIFLWIAVWTCRKEGMQMSICINFIQCVFQSAFYECLERGDPNTDFK